MSENKIPCGGFRIGDGLAMDGDTLKSLGGAYVKVKANINDGEQTLEFMDDSPLKTYEEIVQKTKTSPVTLLLCFPDQIVHFFFLDQRASDGVLFHAFSIAANFFDVTEALIDSDNNITLSTSRYTLTPAT